MKLKRTCKNVNLLIKIRDKSERKTKLYDHSIPMIKKLKKEGYKIAIISNSSVFAIKHLKNKTKLLKYIDYPIFSFDVGVIKPNPKIFRALLKKAKCKPKEVIMIGDNFKDDVIPAKKMGINAIHYTTYEALKEELKKYGINA
jgi:putative hydrolase of the HAD superfamily